MLPDDEDAKRLCKQTFHFGEFLAREEGYDPPQLAGRALLHGHCHGVPQTLLVASGFSCRSQVEQLAGPKPLHVAQVLRLARGRSVSDPGQVRERQASETTN
jgi:hypothetical protein